MVAQPIDHCRKLFMKHESHEGNLLEKTESQPKVDDVDIFTAARLLQYLMLFFIIYMCRREYHKSGEKKENETRKEEIKPEQEELQKKLEELQNKLEKLQKEMGRRKAQFKSAWRNAPLYADWRKEEFEAVKLTLDAASAHPALRLSEKGRQVAWQERPQDLPSSTQRFDSLPCVLGQLNITSGRCYWEVEVGDTCSWDLGICRDNITRKGVVTMSPQNGFWAIRLYEGEYWALTSPETLLILREIPLSVGIFLDYEAGDVSFYNMTDGSHIFTFPQNTFYGILRPLFRLWSSDSGLLTIVKVEEN
ncbi:butyrophilin subfamily 1 member A1-like isoform X11 [Equus asinus]|uniref:butyrophilin subfamily 1 member A1-like isoform X11 n=1 Tax=Equus asinus TaxID=9793 RepID=UPI0038F81CFD